MCGIAGLVSWESGYRVPPDLSRILLNSMQHRGPDASGLWEQQDARALLLHHRLSIQDLTPTGAQPMHSHDNGLTIVLNGEIYNKEDLYHLVPDYPFRGTSDTEVVLALYEKYGADMPRLLRGMFAFAIWDERRQALFLARDPYGIKPLYLTETTQGFWFASEVKTLLHVPGVDFAPNPAGHTGFFLWGSVPEPHTLYRGIRSLRSGHTLWLQPGQRPIETQFASIATAFLADGSVSSPQASLGEALLDSVRAHFLSDVPVSVFLSAGLDSSSILGMAASALPAASLNCLTLGFDVLAGTPHDETRESAQTAAHYGVPQQIQIIRWSDFLDENRKFLLAMDQPTIDGVNTYFIARMARAAGCKVALSGIGGDELFAGYPSFHQIPRMLDLAGKLHVSKRFGAVLRHWTAPLASRLTSPKYAGALEYGTTLEDAYLLRRALYMPWELPEILDQELAAAGLEMLADSADSQAQFDKSELDRVRHLPLRTRISFLENTRYMRNQLLRDADWAGMAHSVEIRTPLVDLHLLTQLAPLLRSAHPPSKFDMASSLTQPLPSSILNRRKTGFYVPVREWMMDSMADTPERGLRSWARFVYRNYLDRQS